MPVITISREYGAGGLQIGRRVAERLGLDFVDSLLIAETARRLQLPEETVRRWDERGEGLLLRVLRAMRTAHPEYASGTAWPEADDGATEPAQIVRVTREIIEEVGRAGNAVIVGRGAAFILPAGPQTSHVRIIAPRETRIRRLLEAGGSEEEVTRTLDRVDRERRNAVRLRFGVDAEDPRHYCLVINTGCLSIAAAADLLVEFAGAAQPGPNGAPGA